MSRLNEPENFAGRVRYAAKCIATGRPTSRAFDNCFENHDGDQVAVAVFRRSLKNLAIAKNIYRYLNQGTVADAVKAHEGVPTRKLAEKARKVRAERAEAFAKELAASDAADAIANNLPSASAT